LHIGSGGDLVFYSNEDTEYSGTPTLVMSRVDQSSTFAGHILPNADLAYDLGSTSSQWRSIYVGTGTIYIGGVALGVNQDNFVTVNGNPVITVNTAGNLILPTNGTISYTPDDTNNWNEPAVNTVQAALDELAARVTALQNYEIDGGNAYTPPQGEFIIDGNGA
jgi:hypothetical protein